jgi:phage shock protein E
MKKLLVLLFVCLSFGMYSQVIENVNADKFNALITEKKAVLIDLRTTDEMKSKGYIKGAKQIDFLAKDAEQQIAKLDKSKTYLIYCAAGGRSGDCAELMKSMGFKHVVNLEKGFDGWKRSGKEVEVMK